MKKIVLSLIMVLTFGVLSAQNVQVHYDFGKDRKYVTSTVEMFKPDKWGNTFFFIDMDYDVQDVKGVSLSYFEIARCLKLGKTPLSLHAEYNGGFGQFKDGDFNGHFTINDAWLGGLDYSWNNSDFSKGVSMKALYKYIRDKHDASFQLTAVWYMHFFERKLSFTGFADFWKEDKDFNFDGEIDGEYVFLAEPQLWYNFTENISLGGELEISNNFVDAEFQANPTLGVKWSF